MKAYIGTGLTEGLKLKNPVHLIPSQSATSLALASAVDSPTILIFALVWLAMSLILDTMTSRTGPLSYPSKWISSIITSATSLT